MEKLSDRIERASLSSPLGADMAAVRSGSHKLAMDYRLTHVETLGNALVANLQGLNVLLVNETYFALPSVAVARAVVEVAANSSWLLSAEANTDERAARAYAAMFRAFDKGIANTLDKDAERFKELKNELIGYLKTQRVHVVPRTRGQIVFDDISTVRVGRTEAKTGFQYTQRIDAEIPSLAGLYAGLSGMAHGEQVHAVSTWDRPDTSARLIGLTVQRAVEAWSKSLHAWVGVTPGPFVNPAHEARLVNSIPPDVAQALREAGARASEA